MALNVLFIAVFIGKRIYYHKSANPANGGIRYSEQCISWNRIRNDLFRGFPVDSGGIVFIGDSHTEMFMLNEYFRNNRIYNRGISSNTTTQVLRRLQPILDRHPAKLFLCIGVNDMFSGFTIDSTYKNIVNILDRTANAGVQPYLTSIFPVAGNYKGINDSICWLNTMLMRYCFAYDVGYINVYSSLAVDRRLNPKLTLDSLHLNRAGYEVWYNALKPHVN